MQYLANWRMQLAANHLLAATDSVAEIAERVGYESEAAFSRAFKKTVGEAPSDGGNYGVLPPQSLRQHQQSLLLRRGTSNTARVPLRNGLPTLMPGQSSTSSWSVCPVVCASRTSVRSSSRNGALRSWQGAETASRVQARLIWCFHMIWQGRLCVGVCSPQPSPPRAATRNPPHQVPSMTPGVRIVFQGATARRSDLPASAQACVNAVGVTHIHPSWRSFAAFPLDGGAAGPLRDHIRGRPSRYYTRILQDQRTRIRVMRIRRGPSHETCFANGVRLIQNATTPGNGDKPGATL